MRKNAFIALFVPLALLAAACSDSGGGSDLSDAEQEFADSIAIGFSRGDGGFDLPDDELDCMAEAVIAELGIERFEDADITPEDFESDSSPGELLGDGEISDDEATAVIDEWHDCTNLSEAVAGSASADLGLDDDQVACLADELDDELLDVILVPSFTTESGEPEGDRADDVFDAIDTCAGGEAGSDDGSEDDGSVDLPDNGSFSDLLIAGIAGSLASSGDRTEEQAQCMAEAIVAEVGEERLLEAAGDSGDISNVPADVQEDIGLAVIGAASDCDVSPTAMGG